MTFSSIEMEKELSKRSLKNFVELAWHQVEPGTVFKDNWHIGAVCEHLQAMTNGQIKRLIINIPPGCMKSLTVSVFWPCWEWTFKPETKWISASHDYKISIRDNRRARLLLDSPWYKSRWGHMFTPNKDEWRLTKFSNDKAGFRIAASISSNILGEHADRQICDDPNKSQDLTSTKLEAVPASQKVWDWWTGTMATRLVPKPTSSRLLIQQRLHESDLTGKLLETGTYELLMLPMLYEPERKCITSIGFEDPRTKENELLWPTLYNQEAIELKKKEFGSREFTAQYQQRPAPSAGALFKRSWFQNYWREIPRLGMSFIQSWDCTFTNLDSSDYVVGQVWGYANGQYYLVDQIRDKMSFTETQNAIKTLSAKWPKANLKLIEAAASGHGLVDSLKKELNGVVAEPVSKLSKLTRANSITPLFEAGNVFLPDPKKAEWVNDYIEEFASFPYKKHDDQVDATSQALNRLRNSKVSTYIEAMKKLK